LSVPLLLLQSAEAIQLHSKDFVDSSVVFEDPSEYRQITPQGPRHAETLTACYCQLHGKYHSTKLCCSPASDTSSYHIPCPADSCPALTVAFCAGGATYVDAPPNPWAEMKKAQDAQDLAVFDQMVETVSSAG
jgi:hypothetical protein